MHIDERHRHRCEVRAVLRWRVIEGAEWVRAWLFGYTDEAGKRVRGVAQARGKAAAEQIHRDAAEQWAKGSRGQPGDWRE